MIFPESFIDELKQKLPISKVVGNRVKLQKRGTHYLGLCPFHQEKTPSFTVQDHKGSYYCFGCHVHGDVISFISETERLSFINAIEHLAILAGMPLPKLDKKEQQKIEHQHSLVEVNNKANEWFAKQLKLSINHHVYEYLQQRGISEKEINNFSLGYAPAKGLLEFFSSIGISLDLAVDVGLATKTDKGNYIEKFRERIIFPIKNTKKQIVGFGGRVLNSNTMPKYLNSPETILFKKNNLLYAGDIAYKNALKTDRLVVVEGYIDTIIMHKAGFTETVAALGTAFNSIHLKNLWNMANEPILCFDGDEAGKKAMYKAAQVALPLLTPGFSLKFCILPKGKDPDEVINLYGVEFIKKLLDSSISLSQFIWQNEYDNSTEGPEAKALFEQKIYDLVDQIKNSIVRNYYYKFMKDKLWQEGNKKFLFTKNSNAKIVQLKSNLLPVIDRLSIKERLEYSLFAQLVIYQDLLKDQNIFDLFCHIEIDNLELENLRMVMIENFENKALSLNELLNRNNLTKLIDFISGPKSSFIDIISKKEIEEASKIWFITYKKYLLELLKIEYRQWMIKIHTDSVAYERANEIKKSIDILFAEIIKKENELSPEEF